METICVDQISKSYGRNKVLDSVTFSVGEGEITGFVGPNGIGKTTTIRIATGLIRPDGGKVRIAGFDLAGQRKQALAAVSAIVESPALYSYMSGYGNIDYIRRIRRISREKMERAIEAVGLTGRIRDKVSKYSVGMRQRLALGLCLMSGSRLLILDEPMNGLDPTGVKELKTLLKTFVTESGGSVFLSSHNLPELEDICDRILFIKGGRIASDYNNRGAKGARRYRMRISNREKADKILSGCGAVEKFDVQGEEYTVLIKGNALDRLLKDLAGNGVDFTDFEAVGSRVSDEYQKLYE